MTISYANLGVLSLLCRWRGSLWRAVKKDLLLFLVLYFAISFWYRYGMSEDIKGDFELLVVHFDEYTRRLPLTFLLGFYITTIVNRWWKQFQYIAWPDDCMSMVNLLIKDRETRHQMARYLCLTCALGWREISEKVRGRFPTMTQLIQAGLMTEKEFRLFNRTSSEVIRYKLPIYWIQNKIRKRVIRGIIVPQLAGKFVDDLNRFADKFRRLLCYDWVSVPLVYTQVSALATYGFFALCLIGRQFLDPRKKIPDFEVDLYIPVFTIMQFLFFVGWFKVGQELLRPFGEDDDDFELNYLLDRHLQVVFTMASEVVEQDPEFEEDPFWGHAAQPLAHTRMSLRMKNYPPVLHANVKIKNEEDIQQISGEQTKENVKWWNCCRKRKIAAEDSTRIRRF